MYGLTSLYKAESVCELFNLADELHSVLNHLRRKYKRLIGGSDPGGVSYTLLDAFKHSSSGI